MNLSGRHIAAAAEDVGTKKVSEWHMRLDSASDDAMQWSIHRTAA